MGVEWVVSMEECAVKRRWKRRVVEVRTAFAEKAFWDGRAAGQRLTQPFHYFRPEDVVRGPVLLSDAEVELRRLATQVALQRLVDSGSVLRVTGLSG